MQETMMPTYVVCWWSLRQAKNSELTESRIEKELWICEAVIPSSSVLRTG